jgi:hypothetical protein
MEGRYVHNDGYPEAMVPTLIDWVREDPNFDRIFARTSWSSLSGPDLPDVEMTVSGGNPGYLCNVYHDATRKMAPIVIEGDDPYAIREVAAQYDAEYVYLMTQMPGWPFAIYWLPV